MVKLNPHVCRWCNSSHCGPWSPHMLTQPLPLWFRGLHHQHLGVWRLRRLSWWQWRAGMSHRYCLIPFFFLFNVKFSLTKLKKTLLSITSILVSLPAANNTVTLTPVPTRAPAPPPAPGRCSRGQFMCRRPPHCIPDWQRCDGQPHCQDSSDEAQCRESLLTLHL